MGKTVNSKILVRRDTSANWSANNPVLAAGEIGFDTTTKKHKIGDGSTAWNSLPYFLLETGAVTSFNGSTGAITYTAPVTSVNGQTGAVTLTIPEADDKTWNDYTLNPTSEITANTINIPWLKDSTNKIFKFVAASSTPSQYYLAKYDINAYLYSTTPSANDNSTKVATTAYVDNAMSGVVDTNTTYTLSISNNRITLTPSSGTESYIDLPVYNGGVS